MINRKELLGEILHLDEDYGLSFQDVNGLAMCHCQVASWSPRLARRIRSHIGQLITEHRRDAYGVSDRDDFKHKKWLKLMGFEKYKNKWIIDPDGNDRIVTIYIRKYYDSGQFRTR